MCMFMAMAEVRGTEIFATRYAGRQVLVYGAKVETRERNAMVLPIPVASRGTRVELLDLSAAPRFFLALRDYYMPQEIPGYGPPPALGAPAAVLEVFTVGSYEASIVPSLDDFGRLDVRFRLTSGLQQVLAERYGDWAFVVYQMAAGKHELHPFGVAFESRFSGHLFFPTVHVHDGGHAPRTAQFAHQFYAQGARLMSRHDPPTSVSLLLLLLLGAWGRRLSGGGR